ncbi:MAG TPA: DegT/DnrJ/EryC1/StrS aminotransferase family protein, partial [Nitrospirae bacterium]|nr:DegT/DnrJ/EryC1/StrS aminotransferase family protein [Nitrospirota bacterium]
MMKKMPVIGYRIPLSDLLSGLMGFVSSSSKDEFRDILSGFIKSRHVSFMNSGISAFYIALLALKKRSHRTEVVLPAYTAPSLVVAVNKAGLKPVLCDISLEDFNMDTDALLKMISSETLCVVCVHMFGMPVRNIEQIKHDLSDDIFLLEDCAQAMGSKTGGRFTGGFGDLAVFSFNRGKNLPTYGGGGIFTNSDELAADIENIVNNLRMPGLIHEISLFLKFICLSIVFRPVFYSLLYPFISQFKEDRVP